MAFREAGLNFKTSDSGLIVPETADNPSLGPGVVDVAFEIAPATTDGWVLTTEGGIVGWAPGSGGVDSISKSGSTPLVGDITLSAGAGVTLSQVGQDIAISSSASGSGSDDGWLDDTTETWTYASGSGGGAATFTVSGDQTSKYTKGTRIKLTQTTVKYFVCTGSSHAAGTTTVSVFAGTDYTLANAAISANYHSYAANPQLWPGWFTWAPAPTGYTGSPTITARFSVIDRLLWGVLKITGTSNATTITLTYPIAPAVTLQGDVALIVNSGSTQTSGPGLWRCNSGTTAGDVIRDGNGTPFSNSGTKTANGLFFYEI